MKIVFVKVRDPIAWREPTNTFFEDDKNFLVCNVVRYAGLLIHETESDIIIGTIEVARDNPTLDEFGVIYPRFRGVTILAKNCILDRQDFEVKETTR